MTDFKRGQRVVVLSAFFLDPTCESGDSLYPPAQPDGTMGIVTGGEPNMFYDGSTSVEVTLDNGRRVWGHKSNFRLPD